MAEIRSGDPDAVARRLAVVNNVPILQLSDDVLSLMDAYDTKLGLFGRARADLPHFAYAVAFEMDYLLTWNGAHIANGEIVRRLREVNEKLNRFTPLIVTPEEILEAL